MIDGFLPVQKPIGLSSFDVIRVFKRSTQFSGKVGHAGTLDVFASGVMILMLGSATRSFDALQGHEKSYRASARLGVSSSTLDIEGVLTAQVEHTDTPPSSDESRRPSFSEIVEAASTFRGEMEQAVPLYSAAKQNGQPLYKLARAEKTIIPKSKQITIHDLSIVAYKYPLVTFDVKCSSGTYVRQLSVDLFAKLGTDSFLFALERKSVGPITLEHCCTLEDFSTDRWEQFVRAPETV